MKTNIFPLCSKMGLHIRQPHGPIQDHYTFAGEVERLLEAAPVVNGCFYPKTNREHLKEKGWAFDQGKILDETSHMARLILIEPIKRGVSKDEILRCLLKADKDYDQQDREDLAKRIQTEGVIP